MPGLIVRPRSRILHGHDWVYSTEVLKVFGAPQNGDVISIKDGKDRSLGSAIYNGNSPIVARRFSHQRQELDRDFFQRRLRRAQEYRNGLGVDPLVRRVVWSESDGLPGVIVDRYGSVAILQTMTIAMDQRRELLATVISEVLGVTTVVERNDSSSRKIEGLEPRVGLLLGEPPANEWVTIGGVKFLIDFLHGQKTGFYLDQVTNYRAVAGWAKGRRVLDCFSNQGAFAIACALQGASEVTAVESGADNLPRIKAHAQANEVLLKVIGDDVFDLLGRAVRRGEEYDLIILDPPPFTRTRKGLKDALRGYRELHLKAAQLLTPDGVLATFSCSHHVGPAEFHQTVTEAFYEARRSARQRQIFSQSPDHPIVINLPETEYLKGFLYERMAAF
ncbi:MAG: class I SAM-dependent rRNA methyltransferase [Chthoniobacterales bacterium]|nr:class I SAM-dependent rRNA methyltransferase [Chthoniobacterales bacterium]